MSSTPALLSYAASDLEAYLRPVGDFYICTDFNEEIDRPPRVKIGENLYYRFMNYIYLPQPPESLSTEKVIEICDLRLEYLYKLVDYKHNSRVAAAIADYVKLNVPGAVSKMRALDFGCGSGLSSQLLLEHLPNIEIVGVDISEKAVHYAKEQGLAAIRTHPDEALPFGSASFDLIFAIFVMHFNVDMSTLAELSRVLRPSGRFVFNIYQRDIDGVTEQLKETGFDSVEVIHGLDEIGENHMIISCSILASS